MFQTFCGVVVTTAALVVEGIYANLFSYYLGSASVRSSAASGPVVANDNNVQVWASSPSVRSAVANCVQTYYKRTPTSIYGDDDFSFSQSTCFLWSPLSGGCQWYQIGGEMSCAAAYYNFPQLIATSTAFLTVNLVLCVFLFYLMFRAYQASARPSEDAAASEAAAGGAGGGGDGGSSLRTSLIQPDNKDKV